MTTPVFHLRVLGPCQLTADADPVPLRSREQRVVALLALRDLSTRADLAAALWPDSTRPQAQGSLRAAIFNLRREAPGVLLTKADTVALSDRVTTDVGQLTQQVESVRTAEIDDTTEEKVAELDAPELLTGWYEEWVEEERESLRTLRLEGLLGVAQKSLDHDRPDAAQAAAAAALVVDPLHEASCGLLMRAHLALDERVAAVREFERFRNRLNADVGMQPSRRLHTLAYGGTARGCTPRRLRPVRSPAPRRPFNRRRGA